MVSVFNIEELQRLLEDLYHITQIRITVFDSERNELVSYPESCPTFCSIIRSTPEGRAACAKCDNDACDIASKLDKAYIYRCHAGLTEAIMPLYVGQALVGYLLFGHVFAYNAFDEGWEEISKCCRQYPIDMEQLRLSCQSSPLISKSYIKSAARVLHATASYLVLERMATLKEDSSAAKLDRYLNENYTQPLTSQHLCRELGIGRSQLFKLSSQLYGCGITQQLKRLRMEKAKRLLTDNPKMSIADIANACGYSDYNYFIAVFSRYVGLSPNTFRKTGK